MGHWALCLGNESLAQNSVGREGRLWWPGHLDGKQGLVWEVQPGRKADE